MARYRYFKSSNGDTVCVSSYAKKRVRGIARCNPNDTFNEQLGKDLARLRCDFKIAQKRLERADENERIVRLAMFNAEKEHAKAWKYLEDSIAERDTLKAELDEFNKTHILHTKTDFAE